MLRFLETKVVFREVPEEITLSINITNCPIRCKDCHSKHLWENVGSDLTITKLNHLITENKGITCICFMGGDSDTNYLNNLAKYIKSNYNIKVGWYSGQDTIDNMINLEYFDYIKIGHFNGKPLNDKDTNQILYRIDKLDNKWELVDITNKLW
jgi:anaerobic ribonucleoside-triphosphate reductase activating protein